MYKEQQHAGAVKSRTHETCLVAEPVVLAIDGKDIELSLADAVALHKGRREAIKCVIKDEKAMKGDGRITTSPSSPNLVLVCRSHVPSSATESR